MTLFCPALILAQIVLFFEVFKERRLEIPILFISLNLDCYV